MAQARGGTGSRPQPKRPQPCAKFRRGRITATVWENQGEQGPWYSTTIARSYKDGDEWKTSNSYGRDDLPLVARVAALAHDWIFERQQGATAAQGGEPQSQGGDDVEGGNEDIPF